MRGGRFRFGLQRVQSVCVALCSCERFFTPQHHELYLCVFAGVVLISLLIVKERGQNQSFVTTRLLVCFMQMSFRTIAKESESRLFQL